MLIVFSQPENQLRSERFEKSLEDFCGICDQIEVNLVIFKTFIIQIILMQKLVDSHIARQNH